MNPGYDSILSAAINYGVQNIQSFFPHLLPKAMSPIPFGIYNATEGI